MLTSLNTPGSRWLLAATLLLAGAGASAQPGPKAGQFYLNGGAAMYSPPDDDVFEDEAFGPAAAIGYGITERWAAEFLYSRIDVDYEFPGDSGDDTTHLAWLDFLYQFSGNEAWQPFVLFGGGYTESDRGSRSSTDDLQLNAGLGVFRALNQRFSLRGDVRAVYSDDENELEPFAFLGITALLGPISSAPGAVADADGDGVPDGRDRCPGTAAGASVDAQGCESDSDGDGVSDRLDACPGTAAGLAVDSRGCPRDADGDGVADADDACPDTAPGARVDERGCYEVLEEPVTINLNLEFDSNSAELRPEHEPELRRVAAFLREYPTASAVIEGHTDSDGDAAYNQQLSERRAAAVLEGLVNGHGVARQRLNARGFGESRPLRPNTSTANKQTNRRVTVVVSGTREVTPSN